MTEGPKGPDMIYMVGIAFGVGLLYFAFTQRNAIRQALLTPKPSSNQPA